MDISKITKNELHAQNTVLRAENADLRAQLSQLRVQLEAERSIGRNNVRGATAFRAAMDELKQRAAAGEKVKLVNGHVVSA